MCCFKKQTASQNIYAKINIYNNVRPGALNYLMVHHVQLLDHLRNKFLYHSVLDLLLLSRIQKSNTMLFEIKLWITFFSKIFCKNYLYSLLTLQT
jgi:hypothetical protein